MLFVFVLTRDAFHSLSRVLRNATSHTAILTQTEQSATQQLERMAKEVPAAGETMLATPAAHVFRIGPGSRISRGE